MLRSCRCRSVRHSPGANCTLSVAALRSSVVLIVTSPGLFPHDGNARTNSLASPRLRRPQARQGCARRERTGRRTGASLGVDQDRGVAVTPAQGEVVDPECPQRSVDAGHRAGRRPRSAHHARTPGSFRCRRPDRARARPESSPGPGSTRSPSVISSMTSGDGPENTVLTSWSTSRTAQREASRAPSPPEGRQSQFRPEKTGKHGYG